MQRKVNKSFETETKITDDSIPPCMITPSSRWNDEEDSTEDGTDEDATEDMSEEITEDMSEEITEDVSEDITEDISNSGSVPETVTPSMSDEKTVTTVFRNISEQSLKIL